MASAESVALADQKRALRRAMGEKRTRLTVDERARADVAVTAQLASLPEMRATGGRRGCVAGFAATRAEIDPAAALDEARRTGARVVLPRVAAVEGDDGAPGAVPRPRLRFHVAEPHQLRPGRFGIAEPDEGCPEVVPTDVDVMFVPGLAFDARGNRLGFGGGYYDELLTGPLARRPAFVVGVGYDFQVVDACPAGDGDAAVDCVVTDARVIRCQPAATAGAGEAAGDKGKVDR